MMLQPPGEQGSRFSRYTANAQEHGSTLVLPLILIVRTDIIKLSVLELISIGFDEKA